jgi:hypothetical protein
MAATAMPARQTATPISVTWPDDVWMMLPGCPEITGFTYPHESDLRNEVANLNERIDLILLKNCPARADGLWLSCRCAEVIGEEESDRTAVGTWPSDHAGVVATLGWKSGE